MLDHQMDMNNRDPARQGCQKCGERRGGAAKGASLCFGVTELSVVEKVILAEKELSQPLLTNIMNIQREMTDPGQFNDFWVSNCRWHC